MALSRDRSRRRNGNDGTRGEDVNPMNYLSNLADAMLVLAVGIMVALVLHWNVELTSSEMSDSDEESSANTFTEDDLYEEGELPAGAKHAGEVYYDEASGEYYFVESPSAGNSSASSDDESDDSDSDSASSTDQSGSGTTSSSGSSSGAASTSDTAASQ